jgi:hypothetical protein
MGKSSSLASSFAEEFQLLSVCDVWILVRCGKHYIIVWYCLHAFSLLKVKEGEKCPRDSQNLQSVDPKKEEKRTIVLHHAWPSVEFIVKFVESDWCPTAPDLGRCHCSCAAWRCLTVAEQSVPSWTSTQRHFCWAQLSTVEPLSTQYSMYIYDIIRSYTYITYFVCVCSLVASFFCGPFWQGLCLGRYCWSLARMRFDMAVGHYPWSWLVDCDGLTVKFGSFWRDWTEYLID